MTDQTPLKPDNKDIPIGNLVGQDGNSLYLCAYWANRAKAAGWTKDEIKPVIDKALSSDYDNVIRVLSDYLEYDDDE